MRVVIQRVARCSVDIGGERVSETGHGMLVLVAVEGSDTREDAEWLCAKIAKLRIFDDGNGVMNLDIGQVGGELMIVSQFTLYASTRKGNRPSYIRSAPEQFSRPMYEYFVETARRTTGCRVETGRFGADMKVELVNDGPVTICIDSRLRE